MGLIPASSRPRGRCCYRLGRITLPTVVATSRRVNMVADPSLERYSQGETEEEELQHLLDEVRNIGRFAGGVL